jgi:endonuclease YncB( thermonuclease family)
MHRAPVLLMLLLLSSTAFANDFVGQASVIDGDTLEIHGTRIRLWGVDAPESSQLCRGADSNLYRCGANAANDLDTFIARQVYTHIRGSIRAERSDLLGRRH